MRVVFCFKMEPRYCVSYGRREGRTKGGLASFLSHIIMPHPFMGQRLDDYIFSLKDLFYFMFLYHRSGD